MTHAQRLERIADSLIMTALRNGPADDGDLSDYDGCDYSNLEDEGMEIQAWLEANDPPATAQVSTITTYDGRRNNALEIISAGGRTLGHFSEHMGFDGLWHFCQKFPCDLRRLYKLGDGKPGTYPLYA